MNVLILIIQLLFFNQLVDCKGKQYIQSLNVMDKIVEIEFNDSLSKVCGKRKYKLYNQDSLQYFKYKDLDVYLDVYEELDLEILSQNSEALKPYFDNKIAAPKHPPVKPPFAVLYFIVDSKGNIVERGGELDIESKSESGQYGKEMVGILNGIDIKITPGQVNGKPVATLCRIPVDLIDIKFKE